MADAPYLIALALLEQNGERAMPLQGKSLREALPADADPGEVGRQQALELMLRVWQRSDQGPVTRAAGEHSLLLITVPIEALQEAIPAIRRNGSTVATPTLCLSSCTPWPAVCGASISSHASRWCFSA